MRYSPDTESCIFRTRFIYIIILSIGCLHKQWHWPTSGNGKDVGCLSDVNIKSYVFLRNLSFSESRQLGDNCIQNFHLGRYIVWFYGWKFCFRATGQRSRKT